MHKPSANASWSCPHCFLCWRVDDGTARLPVACDSLTQTDLKQVGSKNAVVRATLHTPSPASQITAILWIWARTSSRGSEIGRSEADRTLSPSWGFDLRRSTDPEELALLWSVSAIVTRRPWNMEVSCTEHHHLHSSGHHLLLLSLRSSVTCTNC